MGMTLTDLLKMSEELSKLPMTHREFMMRGIPDRSRFDDDERRKLTEELLDICNGDWEITGIPDVGNYVVAFFTISDAIIGQVEMAWQPPDMYNGCIIRIQGWNPNVSVVFKGDKVRYATRSERDWYNKMMPNGAIPLTLKV